jgi:hypothetical protein
MLEKLKQDDFEHLLDVLILYSQLNPKKNVYLNERCIKEAFYFMNNQGKDIYKKLD